MNVFSGTNQRVVIKLLENLQLPDLYIAIVPTSREVFVDAASTQDVFLGKVNITMPKHHQEWDNDINTMTVIDTYSVSTWRHRGTEAWGHGGYLLNVSKGW